MTNLRPRPRRSARELFTSSSDAENRRRLSKMSDLGEEDYADEKDLWDAGNELI